MKALSIRQPWASLILYGGKDIENRMWYTTFRGRVLIHAAKTQDPMDDALALFGKGGMSDQEARVALMLLFPAGGIIGSVEIVDCVRSSDSPWFEGPFGLLLRDPQPLSFRPCRGWPGFFEVPEETSKCPDRSSQGTPGAGAS